MKILTTLSSKLVPRYLYKPSIAASYSRHVATGVGVVRNLALLRPDGPKYEAEGREWGSSSWEGAVGLLSTS